jgi:tubulin polyglutamylase TTLL6/13
MSSSQPIKAKKKKTLTVNASTCKYDIVKDSVAVLGFSLVTDPKKWCLYWIDTGVSLQRILEMEPYQKINHFPGMSEICRKNLLARNLSNLSRIRKRSEFDFFPKSWILPSEWSDLNLNYRRNEKTVFIVKPDKGCQGKGIFLAKSPKDIERIQKKNGSVNNDVVVQKYVLKPFLIDGFKFDLRVYVLVTSMEPLRIFVYNEGLARFATEPYSVPKSNNYASQRMHLTNYAINKSSENFDKSDQGSKRSMRSVLELLESKGIDTKLLWNKICRALVKTLLIVQPKITKTMGICFPKNNTKPFFGSQCFEILGFDILIDSKCKPWVLEVNHSPSVIFEN